MKKEAIKKIHIIIGQFGKWDDFYEEVLKAFVDKEKANKFLEEYDKDMKIKREKAIKRTKEIEKEILDLENNKESIKKLDKLWDEQNNLIDNVNYESVYLKEIILID